MKLPLLSDMYCTSIISLYLKRKSDKADSKSNTFFSSTSLFPGAVAAHTLLKRTVMSHFQKHSCKRGNRRLWAGGSKNMCSLLDQF